MNDKPVLEDPPHEGRMKYEQKWLEAKSLCDDNPGRWVRVAGDFSRGSAGHVGNGGNGFTRGQYESRMTGIGAPYGRVLIYVRRIEVTP